MCKAGASNGNEVRTARKPTPLPQSGSAGGDRTIARNAALLARRKVDGCFTAEAGPTRPIRHRSQSAPPTVGVKPESDGSRSVRRSARTPMLEALAAVDGAPLRQPEGNGRFLPTLGTSRGRDRPHRARGSWLASLGLTSLASLGLIPKALLRVEKLFPGGEHELSAALRALDNLVLILHQIPPALTGTTAVEPLGFGA